MYLLGFDHFTGPTNAVQLVLTLKVCNSLLSHLISSLIFCLSVYAFFVCLHLNRWCPLPLMQEMQGNVMTSCRF